MLKQSNCNRSILGPAALGRPAGCQVTEMNFFTYKHVRTYTHTQHTLHKQHAQKK